MPARRGNRPDAHTDALAVSAGASDTLSLRSYIDSYRPTAESNDAIWSEFDRLTSQTPFLAEHRRWIEENRWGFGDRAFHYMWYLLLIEDILRRPAPTLLEIGVYKGQVISLWRLIASRAGVEAHIYAISPLRGTRFRLRSILHRMAMRLSRRYRENVMSGNQYDPGDYEQDVRRIFEQFNLNLSGIHLVRGYSEDPHIKERTGGLAFDLVYIDGGHRYEEVTHDIRYYGERVKISGYMVLDDASYYLPGTRFWKGHESVSRAAEEVDVKKFKNILNVGHNRIYQRVG